MSTNPENYVCSNCGLKVPEDTSLSEVHVELWSGGTSGQNARHVWLQGCDAARKRIKNAEEPDLVY